MTSRASVSENELPVADLLHIDDACDRFEAAWRNGQEPELARFLADASAQARPRLLRELLAIELEFRRDRGERPEPEAYRAGIADHANVIDEVFAAFRWDNATIPSIPGSGAAWFRKWETCRHTQCAGIRLAQSDSQPRGEHGDAFGRLRGAR